MDPRRTQCTFLASNRLNTLSEWYPTAPPPITVARKDMALQ